MQVVEYSKLIFSLLHFVDEQKAYANYFSAIEDPDPQEDIPEDANLGKDSILSEKEIQQNFWSEWAAKIEVGVKRMVEKKDDGNLINVHHMPRLANYIMQHMCSVSLWSCITHEEFAYDKKQSTSSGVESDSNDVKNRLFKNDSLPLRADEFVKKHINYLSGKLILQEKEATKSKSSAKSSVTDDNPVIPRPDESSHITKSSLSNNNSQPSASQSSQITENVSQNKTLTACLMCSNGHFPSKHSCIVCQKKFIFLNPVHTQSRVRKKDDRRRESALIVILTQIRRACPSTKI